MEKSIKDKIQELQLCFLQDYLEIMMSNQYGDRWISEIIKKCENNYNNNNFRKTYENIVMIVKDKGSVMVTKNSFDVTLLSALLEHDFTDICAPDKSEKDIFKRYISNLRKDKNQLVSHISDFNNDTGLKKMMYIALDNIKDFLKYLSGKGWLNQAAKKQEFINNYNKLTNSLSRELNNSDHSSGSETTTTKKYFPIIIIACAGAAAIIAIIVGVNAMSGKRGNTQTQVAISNESTTSMDTVATTSETMASATSTDISETSVVNEITTFAETQVINETSATEALTVRSSPVTVFDGNVIVQLENVSKESSSITISIQNNYSDMEVTTFGLPTLVVDGQSTGLNGYDNMMSSRVSVAPMSSANVTYKVDRLLFEKGGRLEGQLFIMGPSSDRDYSLNITLE